jgi:predicted ATPase
VEGKTKPPNNLPRLGGPTIGRDKELSQLQTLLQNPELRLITVVGPGGVGKTRLILQTGHALANKFEDGVFFICLAAINEPALVLEMIAQVLEVKEVNGLSLLQTLEAYLATKQILLIIDNFEQVKSAARSLINLLAATPGLKFLIGSRITLQIYPEQVFELLPLALPPVQPSIDSTLSKYGAMELLLQRAKQVKPDLTMTPENALALTQICQRLDGLPLALELAAARLKFFTPQALLRRLEGAHNSGPLQLLEKANKDGPTRQQSLRQTLDWSYNLLEHDEQHLFCTLAIFNDGCSLVACETVCTSFLNESGMPLEPSKVLNLLTQLVEKSLLRHENDPEGEPRFTMLQTIREYALERLKRKGAEEILWQHYTDYFVTLADTADKSSEQPIWIVRLEKEHNNLRAVLHHALEYLQVEIALQLVVSLWWFWEFQGYLTEGLRWAEEILAQSEALQDDPTISELRVKALNKVDGLSHYNALSSKE